jgi:hypothetical protein
VASSKLTDDGRCIVTTPDAGYEVGDVFYVLGSGATYGIRPSDWVLRLLTSRPLPSGRAWGEGVSVLAAEETLLENLRNGSLHPSLVEEPREAA